jgi:PRTRC genetic system protein E
MFKELITIMGNSTLSFTIARSGANELTVGITPKSTGSEISPVIVVGSPEELDENLISGIAGFIQDSQGYVLKKNAAKKSMEEKKSENSEKSAKPGFTPVKNQTEISQEPKAVVKEAVTQAVEVPETVQEIDPFLSFI